MRFLFVAVLVLCATLTISQPYKREWWQPTTTEEFGGDDRGNAVAMDASGAVYVAGTTTDGDTDIIVSKYSSAGALAWTRRYGRLAGKNDEPFDIAADGAGNCYIAAASEGGSTYYDCVVLKYSSTGTLSWVKVFGSTGQDGARRVAVDSTGNIVVLGFWTTATTGADFKLVKIAPGGSILWDKVITSDGKNTDYPSDMVLDSAGNAYVTGYFTVPGFQLNCATLGYDSTGNEMWRRVFNGSENKDDYGMAIALGPLGQLFVTGATSQYAEQSTDVLLLKYSTAGALLGNSFLSYTAGQEIGVDICADVNRNCFVLARGDFESTGRDIYVAKLDSDFFGSWTKIITNYEYGDDQPASIGVDQYGYVYFGASFHRLGSLDPDQTDFMVMKLSNASGSNAGYMKAIDPGGTGDYDVAGMAVNGQGDCGVVGTSYAGLPLWDMVAAKYIQGPVAVGDTYVGDSNANIIMPASAGVCKNDYYTAGATAVVMDPPAAGTLSLYTNGAFTYTPSMANTGDLSFLYKLQRSGIESKTVKVNLRIRPLPDSIACADPCPGGATIPAYFYVTGASPTGGTPLALAHSGPIASAPASLSVPAGAAGSSFSFTTGAVNSPTAASFSISRAGVTKSFSFTVVPARLAALSVSPTTFKGGSSASGTVTLDGKAGTAGRTVSLSDDSGSLSEPPTVTVASGFTAASFTVTSSPVGSTVTRKVIATLGTVTKTAAVTLTP